MRRKFELREREKKKRKKEQANKNYYFANPLNH